MKAPSNWNLNLPTTTPDATLCKAETEKVLGRTVGITSPVGFLK